MVLRWSAIGILEAERGFRKIADYHAMPILVAALCAHDAKIDRALIDDVVVAVRLAEFFGVVFWDVAVSRKSLEDPTNLSIFRQKHRGFTLA